MKLVDSYKGFGQTLIYSKAEAQENLKEMEARFENDSSNGGLKLAVYQMKTLIATGVSFDDGGLKIVIDDAAA